MNSLVLCEYDKCGDRFESVFDQVKHFEDNHLNEVERKTFAELRSLEKELSNCVGDEARNVVGERLHTWYTHCVRMSLFRKLSPFTPDYIPRRQIERKPVVLAFTNYKKRPPAIAPATNGNGPGKRQTVPSKRLGDIGGEVKPEVEEKKFKCPVDGCIRAYKNNNGLRSHMRQVHNMSVPQPQPQQVKVAPEFPVPVQQQHIMQQPSPHVVYQQAPEQIIKQEESKVIPSQMLYRGSSRMTPNEENILNRVQISSIGESSSTPVNIQVKKEQRKSENKYNCDMCSKSYKTAANLRKHLSEQHGKTQANFPPESRPPQRPAYQMGQPQQPVHQQISSSSMAQQMMNQTPQKATIQAASNPQRIPQSPLAQGHSPRHVQQVLHSPVPQQPPQRTFAAVQRPYDQHNQYIQSVHYNHAVSPQNPQTPQQAYEQHEQPMSPYQQQSAPVTVVLQHADDRSAPVQRNLSAQHPYERYAQPQAQRRTSVPKLQSHPYYTQKTVRHNYPTVSGQDYQRVGQPTGQTQGRMTQQTLQTSQPTTYAPQPHYTQRPSMGTINNYEQRTIRRTPQGSSSGLSSQLPPLNIGSSGQSGPTTTNIEGIQITKVPASQYGGPRTNMAPRQIPQQVVGGGPIRARMDPNRPAPGSQQYYTNQPGQSRVVQHYAQRIIRVAPTAQTYPPTSQPNPPQNPPE